MYFKRGDQVISFYGLNMIIQLTQGFETEIDDADWDKLLRRSNTLV